MFRFTLRTPYLWEKAPRYPLLYTLGGLQSQSERFGEERITCAVGKRMTTPRSPSLNLVVSERKVCYTRTGQHIVNI